MNLQRLEDEARARFVRWDPRLWREILDGPATALAGALEGADDGAHVLESYLRLCCEAVGLGYLFPATAGRDSFFTLAFERLIPRLLPRLPPAARPATLAGLWNLGENLESAPVWLARIFHRLAGEWTTLSDLEAVVAQVEQLALQPPAERLGRHPRTVWLRPAQEDARFLPGRLHFVAPTVLCVHDRARTGVTQGMWLAPRPLLLGAMGCDARPRPSPATGARWKRVAEDVRFDEPHAVAANAWRAAATLVTSQQVVALVPA